MSAHHSIGNNQHCFWSTCSRVLENTFLGHISDTSLLLDLTKFPHCSPSSFAAQGLVDTFQHCNSDTHSVGCNLLLLCQHRIAHRSSAPVANTARDRTGCTSFGLSASWQ